MTDEINNATVEQSDDSKSQAVEGSVPATPSLLNTDWKVGLPEDLRSDPTFEKFKDVESLAKSYKGAQSLLGSRIPIPSEDASDDVKNEFFQKIQSIPGVIKLPKQDDPKFSEEIGKLYDKLGRPQTPDKYELEIPDDLPMPDGFIDEITKAAHKAGLSKEQLKTLADINIKHSKSIQEAVKQQAVETKALLEKTWGNAFEENMGCAKGILKKYGEKYPDATNELFNSFAGNNPVVVMLAAELGQLYREKGTIAINIGGGNSMTPELAKQQIADIMGNKAHPYHDRVNPAHDEAVAKVQRLYQDAYPEKKEQSF